MGRLRGKVAIITGAGSGVGRATTKLFAQEGARLVITSRRKADLESLAAEVEAMGAEVVPLAGDVRSEPHAKALVELAVERFGRLDIGFNNAGMMGEFGPSLDLSIDGWNQALAINLTSAFLGAKYQVPEMINSGGGSLIFTSATIGRSFALPRLAAYAASKSGLIGLTQALAVEYGDARVRVNAVLPGAVNTPFFRSANPTDEARRHLAGMHALKRVAEPEELARSVLFLASDDSSFVTGTATIVDGGLSIARV